MLNLDELNEELMIQEGVFAERIQNEALEEGYVHATCGDFVQLVREYGAPYILTLLDGKTRDLLADAILGYVDDGVH